MFFITVNTAKCADKFFQRRLSRNAINMEKYQEGSVYLRNVWLISTRLIQKVFVSRDATFSHSSVAADSEEDTSCFYAEKH